MRKLSYFCRKKTDVITIIPPLIIIIVGISPKMKNVNIHNQQFYLNLMSNEHTWEKYNKTLYNYLNDLDKARATNWRKVLPEIAELWPK